jgi:hypothetical protein
MLHGLDITPSRDSARYLLADDDGKQFTVDFKALAPGLFRLSPSRLETSRMRSNQHKHWMKPMVAREGAEPPTPAFSGLRTTSLSPLFSNNLTLQSGPSFVTMLFAWSLAFMASVHVLVKVTSSVEAVNGLDCTAAWLAGCWPGPENGCSCSRTLLPSLRSSPVRRLTSKFANRISGEGRRHQRTSHCSKV